MSGSEDEEPDLYELLNDGLALYHAGMPFEAHEVWECAWGGAVGRSKLVLQTLILVAAALHKHQAGNPRGTSKLLAKAEAKIAECVNGASSWLGLDLLGMEAEIARSLGEADRIARGEANALVPPLLPRRLGPDGLLYLHGFASGPTSKKASEIVPRLRALGHHVAIPDLNEGNFRDFTISRALSRARRHLRERTLVIGSSLGAYIAALLAGEDERVKGMVLMAPAFSFAARLRTRLGEGGIDAWRRTDVVEVDHHAWGTRERIAFSLFADAERHPPRPGIRVPTHILHGRRDELVPVRLVEEIAARDPGLVELEIVEDDHALVNHAHLALRATERMIDRLRLTRETSSIDAEGALARLHGRSTLGGASRD